jgi:RNA polymerase sigma-70 factor (ECF subfamily)
MSSAAGNGRAGLRGWRGWLAAPGKNPGTSRRLRTAQDVEPSLRARVRAGDPDAFGVLFDECARAVYNLAFRMTGNWSAAEEVVSLTFLEAWRLRGTVQQAGGSLRPWLLGIAVNVARNAARASRRHQAALGRLPPAPVIPDFADDLAGRIDDAARLMAVRSAVARLRRGEQEVLALCVWSGLDYTAAAQALGVPVGTVRSRLSRARAKLAKLAAADQVRAHPAGPNREPGCRSVQVEGGRPTAARPDKERSP